MFKKKRKKKVEKAKVEEAIAHRGDVANEAAVSGCQIPKCLRESDKLRLLV